jgi:hypothetical protein
MMWMMVHGKSFVARQMILMMAGLSVLTLCTNAIHPLESLRICHLDGERGAKVRLLLGFESRTLTAKMNKWQRFELMLMRRPTTHSTRRLDSILFIVLPPAYAVCCSSARVNSSVIHASLKQDSRGSDGETQKTNATLSGTTDARSNNSFNASGISLDFIVNMAVPQILPAALIRALNAPESSDMTTGTKDMPSGHAAAQRRSNKGINRTRK